MAYTLPYLEAFQVSDTVGGGFSGTTPSPVVDSARGTLLLSTPFNTRVYEIRLADGVRCKADLSTAANDTESSFDIGSTVLQMGVIGSKLYVNCGDGTLRRFDLATRSQDYFWAGYTTTAQQGCTMPVAGGHVWQPFSLGATTKFYRMTPTGSVATVQVNAFGGASAFWGATDGTYLYVTNGTTASGYIWRIRLSDNVVDSFTPDGQSWPLTSLACSGGYLYALAPTQGKVVKITTSTMVKASDLSLGIVGSFPLSGNPSTMVFDGRDMFVGSNTSTVPCLVRMTTGGVTQESWQAQGASAGAVFDGTYLWQQKQNGAAGTALYVYRLKTYAADALVVAPTTPPSPITIGSLALTAPDAAGTDVSTYPDLDPNFGLIGTQRAVAEVLLRMLETPRGSLVYAPDRGYDVRALLNESITDRVLAMAKRAIENEAMKDERVEAIDVSLAYDNAKSTLQAKLEITTADGPFRLTLAVTDLSITVLDEGA